MKRAVFFLVLLVLATSSLGCRKLFSKRGRAGTDPAPVATTTAEIVPATPTTRATATATVATKTQIGLDVDLGELRVTMPGAFKTTTKHEPSAAGDVIMARHEATIGDSYFAASLIDVPGAKTWNAPASVNGAIDNALASVRSQPGTKLVRATKERAVTIGDLKGRDVTAVIERTDGTKVHARLLSVSRTRRNVFILAVVHSEDDPLVRRMFASLRVGN